MKPFFTAACFAALFAAPSIARADHGPEIGLSVSPGGVSVHVHSSFCGHHDHHGRPAPAPRVVHHHRPAGQYVLRAVDVWVPPQRVEQVVGQQCRTHGGKHRKVKCKGGYVESSWIPGHYETQEQWVWVDATPRPRYARARW